MIYEGSKGSILCFVDNKIVASVPLTKKRTVEFYQKIAEELLVEALRGKRWSLNTAAKKTMIVMRDRIYFSRKYLDLQENEYIVFMGFILHKLHIWDFDHPSNGLFITQKKRSRH
tara:strand:+ start:1239 stop:1583 length:345 start_codon:yes stop_codon:yes gene_type:complete